MRVRLVLKDGKKVIHPANYWSHSEVCSDMDGGDFWTELKDKKDIDYDDVKEVHLLLVEDKA